MLHPDGIEVAFVHRSFQEYFAAVFATEASSEKSNKILDKYALRFGDSVVSMALEMDRENVEQNWILPTILKIEKQLFSSKDDLNYALIYKEMFKILHFRVGRLGIVVVFPEINVDLVGPIEIIINSYQKFLRNVILPGLFGIPVANMKIILENGPTQQSKNASCLHAALIREHSSSLSNERFKSIVINLEADDDWWIRDTSVKNLIDKMKKGLAATRQDIQKREKSKAKMLLPFFD